MSNNKNILVAGFRFLHHSDSSGYHHLPKYLPCEFVDANNFLFGDSEFSTFKRRINLGVFELLLKHKVKGSRVVHYIYPEDHLVFSVPPENKGTISVATIHLDESWLDPTNNAKKMLINKRREAFARLNGIVTLSSAQEKKVKAIFPNAKVKFIPHGVVPLGKYGEVRFDGEFKIVVVGSNYRDHDAFFDIAYHSKKLHPNWSFHLIGVGKKWKDTAKNYNNVIVYPYLDENSYFKVIQESHVNLLPVSYATANNALLEAHSLGVPTLATDIEGIRDYTTSQTILYKGTNDAIKKLEQLESYSPEKHNSLREAIKDEAKQFYWENISMKMMEFYKELGY